MGNNYTTQIGVGNQVQYKYGIDVNPDYAWSVTRTFLIGRAGVVGMDFNFAAPVNMLQQNIDLGEIIPPEGVIIAAFIRCTIALVGIANINMLLGNVSAGNQFIALGSVDVLNETIIERVPLPAKTGLPANVWLGAVPVTDTWDLGTAGQWLVSVTYKDYSKL
jgi:hypothetical protein